MMRLVLIVAFTAAVAVSMPASAAPISPTYDSFGSFPAATFGGSGIPNHSVAVSNFAGQGGDVTLGLSIAQRFANPPVTNDGAGTFYVRPGLNNGTPGGTTGTQRATWNFNFYGDVAGGSIADYNFRLLYDFDPANGTDAGDLGIVTILGSAVGANTFQNSWNLTFAFLGVDALGVDAPSGSFDPFAIGEYTFALQVFDATDTGFSDALDTVAVNAVATPEPSSMALLGLGAVGLSGGALRRLRKRKADAVANG